MAQSDLPYIAINKGAVQRRHGDNALRTVEILEYTLRKGTGAAFHAIMQEISVPLHRHHGIDVVSFGNSLHDPDCYYLIRAFDSAEKWLRFSMLFMQAMTGAAAHAKTLFAASKPALKQ